MEDGGDCRTMEAKMSARTGKLFLAASLALAPSLVLAQDRAVPRGGGDSGGSHSGGGAQPSPGSSSSGTYSGSGSSGGSSSSSGSSDGSSSSSGTTAERRHPRAGTGTGGGGYYGGYPGNPGYYPGWGGYYPGYGGYWWPYAYYGWYGGGGGYYGGGFGYPGYGGAAYSSYAPNEGGSIRVLVDPAEARVYVDGYYAGVVDDFDGLFQRLHVSPGRHEIALKLEGYESHRMRVYVGPDATIKLHYNLKHGSGESFEDLTGGAPPPEREVRRERERDSIESAPAGEPRAPVDERAGLLKLNVQPEDASVYVDGAFRGSGREAGTLRLPPGRHRIEIVRPGYRTAEREIDVAPGETTPLSVTLERPSL
jgi:hypothetical protein